MDVKLTNVKLEDVPGPAQGAGPAEARDLIAQVAADLYGRPLAELLPLVAQELTFDLEGAPETFGNCFRCALIADLEGYYLTTDEGALASDALSFCKPDYITQRLRLVPLRRGHPKPSSLRFRLEVGNETDKTKTVYSGDLELTAGELTQPLFNNTIGLLDLQPGEKVVVEDITLARGRGKLNAAAAYAVRGFSRPHREKLPHADVYGQPDGAGQRSGFATSSLTTPARGVTVGATFAAALPGSREGLRAPYEVATNLAGRLRTIKQVLNSDDSRAGSSWQVTENGGVAKGLLRLDEGVALVRMLAHEIATGVPDLQFVGVRRPDHGAGLTLQIHHAVAADELHKLATDAADRLIKNLESVAAQARKFF